MQFRQPRPVQSRLQVVGGVITAVEEQPVRRPSDEVARVIVLAADIATVVLQEVHRDQRRHAEQPREENEYRPREGINEENGDDDQPKDGELDAL